MEWAPPFPYGILSASLVSTRAKKPYRKNCKNDLNDAEAICGAVGRPNMRFVEPKTKEQQDIQSLHRIRERLIADRTARAKQLRGLLAEYGIIVPKGIANLRKAMPLILEDAENGLPSWPGSCFQTSTETLRSWTKRSRVWTQ